MFKKFGVQCMKKLKFNFTANTACNSQSLQKNKEKNIRMCISYVRSTAGLFSVFR